jgi:hypothetical protein
VCQKTKHGEHWQQGVVPSFVSAFSFRKNFW